MPRSFQRTLLLAVLAALLVSVPSHAQKKSDTAPATQASLHGKVVDARGAPLPQSTVLDSSGHVLATTGADGSFEIPRGTSEIKVSNPHYVTVTVPIPAAADAPLTVVLETPLESVIVSAYRSPLATADSPASTRILSTQQLRESASPALDGKLRQVPGFELFRRSSSLVANPTTEGISLRGLGSTAASRSLVVLDDTPLNDPYGGWIHWEELPSLAIHSVEVVRGGASDLYGSSAIGGVITVVPVRAQAAGLQVNTSYGGEATTDNAILGTLKSGPWSALGSGGVVATDGYILVAPDARGPIDQPSNVHAQNAIAEVDRQFHESDRGFLRGSLLNEDRHNGTPFQVNSTRLWRYIAGADVSSFVFRFWGVEEHYRQTFSSIAPGRASETPTRYGYDPATELGAALRWHHSFRSDLLILAGADTHDVRASDDETLLTAAGGILNTTARQRQTGVYGEVLYTPSKWTLSASARVDHFSNFDAVQYTKTTSAILPSLSQTPFNPRIGVTRRINSTFALSGSAFRAYRAPTQNELYRTGQVGQQTTLPNHDLVSERATGWETGFQTDLPSIGSTFRVSYFWTQVNRPITALTLATTPTSTLLKRENLGQIESRGISLDYALQPARWISLVGGYQYANATVTKYAQQPQLVGNWIPQVARNMATAQLRFSDPRWGVLSLQARNSGRQYDDDANHYLLASYFRFDAYGSRDFGRHVQIYASGENLFDRAIQVGKTPTLTLGTPRIARVGVHLTWGD